MSEDMTNKVHFRVIGDTHGRIKELVKLASEAKYSLCLGDIGFDYWDLREISSEKLKCLAGNHDNYDKCGTSKFLKQPAHFLGDYGFHTIPGVGEFFYLRGGHSIDWKGRKEGVNWFRDEQISYADGMEALDLYKEHRPRIVFTHECPADVIPFVSGYKTWDGEEIRPSMTAMLLNAMFYEHQPELWVFGHHHKDWQEVIKGTKFRCLGIMSYMDFDDKGNYAEANSDKDVPKPVA